MTEEAGGERATLTLAVDTHCHLFLMEGDPAAIVAEARAAGVGRLICVGIDPESSRRSVELASSFRGVFATAGMHPHSASGFDGKASAAVEELVADPMVVAVGETGLDHYRNLSPREDQDRAFRAHIALSRESGKPLVVHVRDAWDDALRVLEEERAEQVVLHCFTGDEERAREAARRGYFVSFAGNVTYPNAGAMRTAAALVPEGRLLVETDSPFLTPQARRGHDNHPSNVLLTLGALAETLAVDLDEMVSRTATNATEAFPLIA
jgi:TatD DNase family protein